MKLFKYVFAAILYAVMVFASTPAQAGQIELGWQAPETPPDFVQYRIYWGEKTEAYTHHKDVNSDTTSVTISNLMNKKTYYFAATTLAASGQESEYSNEVSTYLDADTDQDGILDQEELNVYGTDPDRADTDGDGVDDGKELAFWKDAWSQDADGDGQINLLDRDADNDGIADGTEIDAQTDPLVPNPDDNPDDGNLEREMLPVVSVQASAVQEPNVPANTVDGSMTTRWAAAGDGQWIMYDIGGFASVQEMAIAWVHGDRRKASFSIEASVDGQTWNKAFSGDSSGTTVELESYTFSPAAARYVRIVGYGNSSNRWNNIAEVELYGQLNTGSLPIASVQASDAHEPNVPANTVDGSMTTRWAAVGDGQWIMYDLGGFASVQEMAIAWVHGDRRKASFSIEASVDGQTWKEVFSGDSSGTTVELESYAFSPAAARYVRIVGYGNSSNRWNNIAEVKLKGYLDMVSLPVVSVQASDAHEPNVPANTVDGSMTTRWAAGGNGQWIMYDIGGSATVKKTAIAWVRGDQRTASFSIETSVDGQTWNEVFSGDSSGTTVELESYTFSPAVARYVRIVGYGNSSNRWNNIAEVELHGLIN